MSKLENKLDTDSLIYLVSIVNVTVTHNISVFKSVSLPNEEIGNLTVHMWACACV